MSNLNYNIDDLFSGGIPQAIDLPEFTEVPAMQNTFEGGIGDANTQDQLQQFGKSQRYISVKPGDDIQKAINVVSKQGGGLVFLKAGTHIVNYDISILSNVVLEGEGVYNTIIDFNNTAKQIQILGTQKTIAGTFAIDTEVSLTTVNGTTTAFTSAVAGDFLWIIDDWYEIASITSDTVLVLVEPFPITVSGGSVLIYALKQKVEIKNLTVQNSHFTTDYDGSAGNPANGNIWIQAARQLYFENIRSIDSDNTTALYPAFGCALNIASHLKFRNVEFLKNHSDGFYGVSTSYISFEQCYFNQNGGTGALLDNIVGEENLFLGCVFNQNSSTTASLQLGNAYKANNIKVIGCTFKNNYGVIALTGAANSGGIIVIGNRNANGITISAGNNYNIIIGNDFSGGLISDSGIGTILRNNRNTFITEEKSFVRMKNTSGGTLEAGDVVILKSVASGGEVTTTTTGGDNKVFGVVATTIIGNVQGAIQVLGKTTALKVDGTTDIAIGDWLTTFTTAKIACKAAAGNMVFAMALEAYATNDSAGVIDALLVTPRLI